VNVVLGSVEAPLKTAKRSLLSFYLTAFGDAKARSQTLLLVLFFKAPQSGLSCVPVNTTVSVWSDNFN